MINASDLKEKLKKYTPHIIAGASLIALGATLYHFNSKGKLLQVTDETLARLKNGEVGYYLLKDGTKILVACSQHVTSV